ncbi:FG-GAP repeat domain-containing protein [Marinobacterium rhizophilum]|uniref:FG-GAP repeat domain-containing protein n=1 Tax=Marinobacterium rhizophilum TaxID=420402 RepID=UPI0003A8A112|nr:VCBS repeat-containing protein [Marinobacterium rhizophilum]
MLKLPKVCSNDAIHVHPLRVRKSTALVAKGISCFLFLGLTFAHPSVGAPPSALSSRTEAVCDVDQGTSRYGLCNAYCEALDCDSEAPTASAKACDRILSSYTRKSKGLAPPCVDTCDVTPTTDPRPITIADFNRDSILDIAALHVWGGCNPRARRCQWSDVVSVLIGIGDGTFHERVNYAVGERPETLAHGDVNNDGAADLVVANSRSDDISLLLGNGDGTFQPQTALPAFPGLSTATLADTNNDGYLDVIFVGRLDNISRACMLPGDGSGIFSTIQCFKIPSDPNIFTGIPALFAIADVNHDDFLDVIAGNGVGFAMSAYLGNGDGTLQAPQSFPIFGVPHSIALDDLNNDCNYDIVVGEGSFRHFSALLGNGDGTFIPNVESFPAIVQPQSIVTAPIDADDAVDLVLISKTDWRHPRFQVRLGDGETFLFNQPFSLLTEISNVPKAVAAADLNGDGLMDVVTVNSSDLDPDNVSVFLGNGDGTFQPERTFVIGD